MPWLGSLGHRCLTVCSRIPFQIETEMRQDCTMFQVRISLYIPPPECTHSYLRHPNIITPVANEGDVQLSVRMAA